MHSEKVPKGPICRVFGRARKDGEMRKQPQCARAGVASGTEGSQVILPASCVLDLCHRCCFAVSAGVGRAAQ